MSHYPRYDKGSWNALCDVCGKEFKSHELKKRWDGFLVDDLCWEPRHPQDFVRGVADLQAPVWTRPEPRDTYLFYCTPITRASQADMGTADCMQADFIPILECSPVGMTCIAGDGTAGCMVAGRLN